MPIRRLEKSLTATTGTVAGEDLAANAIAVNPHIQPGTLQPAVAGKLLNGASHSGAYGTAQTQSGGDGHKYYYTDIKGSKPIKDPRIGSHFGSQRHKFKSIQLLEQETATHGSDVYSIDGREWVRCTGGGWSWINDGHGSRLKGGNVSSYANMFIEVVGYFNGINTSAYTDANHKFRYALDGATEVATDYGATTSATPLGSRLVDAGSLINIPISTTLGIHTIKLRSNGAEHDVHGIELIVQDTTSTATKSKIQIPSQNVVSFGKKFTVAAAAHHYDPFNGFTNSSGNAAGLHSTYVDTATSLGLSTGTLHGATWAISGSNNIRPYNGGRVVRWVDSTGVIKTSVNMMPPNAQNISTTAAAEITTPSATNTAHLPAFSDDAVDHSLAEVAKTFHFREFGNGSANGGTGSSTYADASMLSGVDDIAYVMDDGLTSLSGDDVSYNLEALLPVANGDGWYVTFIGTGVTIKTYTWAAGTYHVAQNLPYGTHILKVYRDDGATPDITIDGILLSNVAGNTYGNMQEITFHQPKMPPIPEDAVIISDYMLMADFVPISASIDLPSISVMPKGTRRQSISRDFLYDNTASATLRILTNTSKPEGNIDFNFPDNSAIEQSIPFFGSSVSMKAYTYNSTPTGGKDLTINGSALSGTTTTDGSFSSGTWTLKTSTSVHDTADTNSHLGVKNLQGSSSPELYTFKSTGHAESGKYDFPSTLDIATSIHTSSHYQSFETPFLHELVGGDRNMEQGNLVVTHDGKTWDEVTRDTSYIGQTVLNLNGSQGSTIAYNVPVQLKLNRGRTAHQDYYIKDSFVMAYDRVICLIAGEYIISYATILGKAISEQSFLHINGSACNSVYTSNSPSGSYFKLTNEIPIHFKRGDYMQIKGGHWDASNVQHSQFSIKKLG